MSSAEDLATYAARLATFERPHVFAKRRASSTKKKAQSAISWPHQSIAPEALARAGFYYKPSSTSQDSVTCFLCDKALDGWEAGDNPATEHLNHVPDCGWAINICIEQRSQDMDRAEEDPQSDKMVKARRDTFRDAWPHAARKGWKCKVDNMVKAGWCYDPLPEADDCVKCSYCGVSLDGWEPKDDPWVEHQKRAPDCHFFFLIEESSKLKSKPKKGNGRASRGSRVSRMSTQSNLHAESVLGSPVASDDEPAEEGDTIMTTASTASRATRAAKKTSKKRAVPKKSKTTRARQGSVAAEPIVDAEESHMDDMSVASPVIEAKPARAAKTRKTRQASTMADHTVEDDIVIIRPTRKISRAQPAPQNQTNVEEEARESEEAAAEEPIEAPKKTTKPPRGKKRTSDGLEKVDSSIVVMEPAAREQSEESKPKSGRKGRATKKVDDSVVEDLPVADVKQKSSRGKAQNTKTVDDSMAEEFDVDQEEAKPKRGRGRPSKSIESSMIQVAPAISMEAEAPPKRKRGRPSKQSLEAAAIANKSHVDQTASHMEDESEAMQASTVDQGKAKKGRTVSKQQPPVSIHEASSPDEQSRSARPHPQPARQRKSVAESPRRTAQQSPTGSPQSSDAENRPPSSRPSLASQQVTKLSQSQELPVRIPLAATPRTSPSKRNIIQSLSSANPWSAVDLETIFLPSPGSRAMQPNATSVDLDDALKRLTSPERDMSVEDWILWNARGAEERLRGECERLIGSFETEGNRALQCLEGVEVL